MAHDIPMPFVICMNANSRPRTSYIWHLLYDTPWLVTFTCKSHHLGYGVAAAHHHFQELQQMWEIASTLAMEKILRTLGICVRRAHALQAHCHCTFHTVSGSAAGTVVMGCVARCKGSLYNQARCCMLEVMCVNQTLRSSCFLSSCFSNNLTTQHCTL